MRRKEGGYMWKQLIITWPVPTGTVSVCVDFLALKFREQVRVKSDGIWSPKPDRDSQGLRPYVDAVLRKLEQPEAA